METSRLKTIGVFLARYATYLLGSGVHTSRTVRNTKRIAEALGVEAHITTLMRTITLTVHDPASGESITEVDDIPELPIRFTINSDLSALSWRAHDRRPDLATLQHEFDTICQRAEKQSTWWVVLLISFSNACFCRLFGGDPYAMLFVFAATGLGFLVRKWFVHRLHTNFYIATTLAALISSFVASCATLVPQALSEIAVATSVLYLIPGVPLINGTIDIVDGHILSGASRLTKASLIIICIATGLALTLMLTRRTLL